MYLLLQKRDSMSKVHDIDIEYQRKKAHKKLMKQISNCYKKQKTANSFYLITQNYELKINYQKTANTNNAFGGKKDEQKICFQYIQYDQAMPLCCEANLSSQDLTRYWGFFNIVPPYAIFKYIIEKEDFKIQKPQYTYINIILNIEVQFDKVMYKKQIKISLNKMNISNDELCKMYIRSRQKIANLKMEEMMNIMIDLEVQKVISKKKEESQILFRTYYSTNVPSQLKEAKQEEENEQVIKVEQKTESAYQEYDLKPVCQSFQEAEYEYGEEQSAEQKVQVIEQEKNRKR